MNIYLTAVLFHLIWIAQISYPSVRRRWLCHGISYVLTFLKYLKSKFDERSPNCVNVPCLPNTKFNLLMYPYLNKMFCTVLKIKLYTIWIRFIYPISSKNKLMIRNNLIKLNYYLEAVLWVFRNPIFLIGVHEFCCKAKLKK